MHTSLFEIFSDDKSAASSTILPPPNISKITGMCYHHLIFTDAQVQNGPGIAIGKSKDHNIDIHNASLKP